MTLRFENCDEVILITLSYFVSYKKLKGPLDFGISMIGILKTLSRLLLSEKQNMFSNEKSSKKVKL